MLKSAARRLRRSQSRCFAVCRECVTAANGLEIGGPSQVFGPRGMLPVYTLAGGIDNCTFARSTIWEGAVAEGDCFRFHPGKPAGRQYILEGTDLVAVPSGSYAFVLSSHMLEHTANPLRALADWARVLKPGGALVLVVPHRDGMFDHRRPVTTLEHLVEDYERQTSEDDLTHLPEILELHDLSQDPGVSDATAFRERAVRNAEVRSLHHHVFDTRLVAAAVVRSGFEMVALELVRPYHIVVVARKPPSGSRRVALSSADIARVLRRSPFPTDTHGDRAHRAAEFVPR